MQDQSKFTLSELKRIKRQAQRQNSKVRRQVETMRKLREDIYELNRQTGFYRDELVQLADPRFVPSNVKA